MTEESKPVVESVRREARPAPPVPPRIERPKEIITMRQLLECGVHFGHQTKRWNSKMKKYIFTSRNDIHVIDLQQTLRLIKAAYELVKKSAQNKGRILFVGTKKQAKEVIEQEARRWEMYYVNHRWLGGTLTNFVTIRKSVSKLKSLEKMKETGVLDKLRKKEASKKTKALNKLNSYFDGFKDMLALPDYLIVVDTQKEHLAIKEARKLKIPVIGIVDTNVDPTEVDYPIPGNDDASQSNFKKQ